MEKFDLKSYFGGFTLLELMIVIAMIAALSALFIATYPSSQKRARDTHRKNDLKQYQLSLERFANNHNGIYPIFTTAIDPSIEITDVDNDVCVDYLGLTTNECPSDPKLGTSVCTSGTCIYQYQSNATGTQYSLSARLEMPQKSTNPIFVVCSSGRSYEGSSISCP